MANELKGGDIPLPDYIDILGIDREYNGRYIHEGIFVLDDCKNMSSIPAGLAHAIEPIKVMGIFTTIDSYPWSTGRIHGLQGRDISLFTFDDWGRKTATIAGTSRKKSKKKHDKYNPSALDRIAQSRQAKFGG
jgi:hypothetical protein